MNKETCLNTWVAIIAGGEGTRLFPYSHPDRPKQFCQLTDKNTFIQATIKNFVGIGINPTKIVIITTNDQQTRLAKEQTLSCGILSQNIYQIDSHFGYAGAMVKAAEFIEQYDRSAIVINTPSDQYLVANEDFEDTISRAIESAKLGNEVIVGVKINDLVVATGCGHAIYDLTDSASCPKIKKFIEKPDIKTADQIMRAGNSACNTGINVWGVRNLLFAINSQNIGKDGLDTISLMTELKKLRVAVGSFEWYDCGTLESLYEVSLKTPNHKNASLGGGKIDRVECRGSLFLCDFGYRLHATGCKDDAVVVSTIETHPAIAIVKRSESQRVKKLAEDYANQKNILTDDFSLGARNNIIMRSNISDDIIVGFVGVDEYVVNAYRAEDGMIDVYVAKRLI